MRKKTIGSLFLLACFGLALSAWAGKGGARTIQGISTYRDDRRDRITSDWEQGPNPACVPGDCPYVSQTEGVKTVVNSNGEWGLDTKQTDNKQIEDARKLLIDFSNLDGQRSASSNTALPWGDRLFIDALTGSFFRRFSGEGTNLWDLAIGETREVDMFITFDLPEDGVLKRWGVRFGPGPDPNPPCRDSDPVLVTRTGEKAWTIEADRNRTACLVSIVIGGGAQVRENRGFYRLPFRVDFRDK